MRRIVQERPWNYQRHDGVLAGGLALQREVTFKCKRIIYSSLDETTALCKMRGSTTRESIEWLYRMAEQQPSREWINKDPRINALHWKMHGYYGGDYGSAISPHDTKKRLINITPEAITILPDQRDIKDNIRRKPLHNAVLTDRGS